MGKSARDDFKRARSGMAPSEPIAPIADHFAKSSFEYQGAAGCGTVASFVKSFGAVRRQRRGQKPTSSKVPRNSRYTPKSHR